MATTAGAAAGAAEEWRVLEFYSGIGGMRYSLLRAGIRSKVVEAFDINNIANDVYEHNFGHRPCQGNIQTLTAADLDKYQAHAWLLSPPCQPYTRQGLQKDSADARAFSFIKILELMQQMLQPPVMLFVENVVGFETSNTHEQLMQVLTNIGFATQEYILSPLQFGVPYSRPRYFCLAKRKPFSFLNPSFDSLLVRSPLPFMLSAPAVAICSSNENGSRHEVCISCEPIRNFLEPQSLSMKQQECRRLDLEDPVSTEDSKSDTDHVSVEICKPEDIQSINVTADKIEHENEGGDADEFSLDTYSVPLSLIERWGSAMDIVYPESRRCCCFTKSYYRYVKGTGSLLATSKDTDSKLFEGVHVPSKDLGLRFFTPREVANLHSFPADFQFPSHVTLRQRYALLGNSLSVAVVASLLCYLFSNQDDQECVSLKS